MSDTVKLIIEIPKSALELLNTTGVDWLDAEHILSAVAHGIPLDDVKAEIEAKHLSIVEKNDFDNGRTYGYDECLSILDNIGKAESENKE